MRFLLNMNLPRTLGQRSAGVGHECRHVGDLGMVTGLDAAIIEVAKRNEEVILTHDLDYGDLLAFSGDAKPSVIILRLRNANPNNLFARIVAALSAIEIPLRKGAIVILEDATLRIRELPIVAEI